MNQPKPYWITMKLEPDPDIEAPQLKDIAGANAEIWVFTTSEHDAVEKATRHIQSCGWRLKEILHVLQPHQEQLVHLDTQTIRNYQHAEQLGINAHFLAWPKKERPGRFSVEPLKKSPKK